ncbi:flagellar hook-basal body protein [Sandaracinobacteroides saxicola]|uniref:Flagellar hook basal-body protein n=1 Tax=Sandaracinobacteroides saxicola TaxID=2759707 RepID=A0A7G5IK17_9SPHN|nr:flagellar hook basal-body protein [Sandaracinobacteroides saxicola]QMW23709.1 flagellar hook basal-body protein [Sandaracinobacteroides saxicola]
MDIGSVVLLGNEMALRRRVDVIANNIANLNTTGFKREQTMFATAIRAMDNATDPSHRPVFQVLDHGVAPDMRDGPFQQTGNPLDIAIVGQGYFGVVSADGMLGHTRAGAIRISDDYFLETIGGRLADADGRPIQVPPEATARVAILPDGTVMAGTEQVGRVGVWTGSVRTIDPRGNTVMTIGDAVALPPNSVRLAVGGLEGSNVSAVVESTALIEAQRAYQSSQRMSDGIGDLQRRMIERLGRSQF